MTDSTTVDNQTRSASSGWGVAGQGTLAGFAGDVRAGADLVGPRGRLAQVNLGLGVEALYPQ